MARNTSLMLKWSVIAFISLSPACSTLPEAIDSTNVRQTCQGGNEIYLLNHGWHTGLAIKAADLNRTIPELSNRFPDSLYYEIGWGDTGFYQSNEITTGLTLRAMFWSDGSVLHIVGLTENPKTYFGNSEVKVINSDDPGYQNMLTFIKGSFQTDQNGLIMPEHEGIYGDSQFYTAVGRYQLFNTCNKWTAKALYSGGYSINPTFRLTASSIIWAADSLCP
jgi:uncharacterized protein (TIGR02117 family)